jgi:hypothetical protein
MPKIEKIMTLEIKDFKQRIMVGALGLSLLAIFFGFFLGGLFGAQEASIKANLKARAVAVSAAMYQGDASKIDYTAGRAWTYLKRAHMHAGGIGAAAAISILSLLVLSCSGKLALTASLALGLGSMIYPIFWLLAGLATPGLGGTDAAKAAYEWIAIPGAVLLLFGILGVLIQVFRVVFARPKS